MKPLILHVALLDEGGNPLSHSLAHSTSILPSLPNANLPTLFILHVHSRICLLTVYLVPLEIALGTELNPGQAIRVDIHGACVQALLKEGHH